jgi:hypothetical protein
LERDLLGGPKLGLGKAHEITAADDVVVHLCPVAESRLKYHAFEVDSWSLIPERATDQNALLLETEGHHVSILLAADDRGSYGSDC